VFGATQKLTDVFLLCKEMQDRASGFQGVKTKRMAEICLQQTSTCGHRHPPLKGSSKALSWALRTSGRVPVVVHRCGGKWAPAQSQGKKILPNPEVYGEKSTNSDRELQSKSIKALQHLSVDTENKIK